jgi:hypothetical protein
MIKTKGDMKVAGVSDEEAIAVMEHYQQGNELYKTEHFKEQLYLMIRWGFEDTVIEKFKELPLRLQDVDFFRLIVLLTKDFSYIEDNLIGTKFVYENVLDEVLAHIFEERYATAKDVKRLQDEKESLKREFELQREFLEKEFDFKEQFQRMKSEHVEELKRVEAEYLNEAQQVIVINLKERIKELEEQILIKHIPVNQIATSHIVKEAQLEALPKPISLPSKDSKVAVLKRFWNRFIFKDAIALKDNFITNILLDVNFNVEQYKVIIEAFDAGLKLEDVKKFAKAEVPVENMKLLRQMLYKRSGIEEKVTLVDKTFKEPDKGDDRSVEADLEIDDMFDFCNYEE